jgi:hypothetical protein
MPIYIYVLFTQIDYFVNSRTIIYFIRILQHLSFSYLRLIVRIQC